MAEQGRGVSGATVLDALSAMIAVLDARGHIIYVNEAWKRFARENGSVDPTFGVGSSYLDACLPGSVESEQDVSAGIRAVLERQLTDFNHVYPCHSPLRERWFRMMVTPMTELADAAGAVVVHADVTALKLTEDALRDREALLSNAQRIAGLGIWHLDALKKQLTWSDETCRIFGIEPGSFAGTFEAFVSFIHPDDRARLVPGMEHPPEGQPIDLEYRIIRPDGTERVIMERGEVAYDSAGVLLRKLGVIMDVTEQHRADRALRESEDRYRDLIEHSGDLICTHDLEGRLLSVNPSASAYTGYSREELLRMNMADLVAPDVRSDFAEYLAAIRENGRATGILKVRTARGEIRYWEYENTLRADGVTFPVVRGRARDITDRVHIERELRTHMTRLTAIIETQRSLASTDASIEELHDTTAALSRQVLGAEGGVLALVNGDRLVYRSVSGEATHVGFSVPLDGSLAGESFRKNRPLRCDDAEHDPRVHAGLCREIQLRSMVVTPIRAAGAPIGVIKVFSPKPNRFTTADESTLALLAESIGAVIERKRAEAALRESEARLLESQRIAQLGDWEWNLATQELWWSEAIYRMFGIDPAQTEQPLTFRDFMEAVHRDDRDIVVAAISRSTESGLPYDIEMRICAHDGADRVLHARGRVFYDHDDRPVRMVGNVQDITARKLAERKLEQSNSLVHIAGRIARIGGWQLTANSERVYWSDEVAAIHDTPPGTHPLIAEAINYYAPEWQERITHAVTLCFAEGTGFDEELEIITARGRRVWVRALGEAVAGAGGAIVAIQGAFQDISDRKRAEERLRQQEEQYRAIVEAVNDAILILDADARVLTANHAACVMHGYELEQLIGMKLTALVHPADLERVEQIVTAARAGDAAYAEAVHIRQDGTEVQVVANSTSFLLAGVPHVLMVVSNVSEQKRLQQQLERSDRISSLGRLAANIAHEMNNVMMGILPFTEIIRRRTTADAMLQNAATHIAKSVERGKVVTQEILRFTRAASDPELRSIDGARLLTDVADELRSALPPSIALEVRCEPELHVLGDASQLQQVVTNLVVNARDAMPSGGRVSLEMLTATEATAAPFAGVDDPRQYVQLEVRDEGTGIAPTLLGQIFEPLFTTKGSGGTGLGLAIVHQIVALHGGQIHVDSRPGAGTTFQVLLRKATADVSSETIAHSAAPAWRNVRHVVLVEDEPLVAEGIAALLATEGVTCERIERGAEAIARLRNFRPDLLILDVGLPDVSGIDVYRAVARTQKNLPTIFSTGHGDHRLLADLGAPATVRFISKPYDFDELSRTVAQLVSASQS